MGNMSYCRFRNTLEALQDCSEHLDDDDNLSVSEQKAKSALIKLCHEITTDTVDDDSY